MIMPRRWYPFALAVLVSVLSASSPSITWIVRIVVVGAVLAFVLAGCGDGAFQLSAGNSPPTASILVPAVAEERSTINLDGSLSSDDGGDVTFLWTVLGTGDVPVRLHGPAGAVVRLLIGEVTEAVVVEVALSVMDEGGLEDVETATIRIEEIDVALLPPNPGRASLDTLEGIDVNSDGVRDDVERALYELHKESFNNRQILKIGARAYQQTLLASGTPDDRDDDAASATDSLFAGCLVDHSDMDASTAIATVQALMFNTDDRVAAYRAYSAGRSRHRARSHDDSPRGLRVGR